MKGPDTAGNEGGSGVGFRKWVFMPPVAEQFPSCVVAIGRVAASQLYEVPHIPGHASPPSALDTRGDGEGD